ncbi:MAG: hypothetical protein AB7O73_09410, partial [Bacteroidia bacterium]
MKLFYVLLALCIAKLTLACDICGAYFGVVPYDNQSSISFLHRYRVFNGYRTYCQKQHYFPDGAYRSAHESHGTDTNYVQNYYSSDYESFKSFELRGKLFIHKRIELNAITSIVSNKSKEDTVYYKTTGFSDPSFYAAYHILLPDNEKSLRTRLVVGLGVKIPSGNYYVRDKNNKRLPFVLQHGTGSVDCFGLVTYSMLYKKFGLSSTGLYKVNGENYYKERVGNSLVNYANIFYSINFGNWSINPNLCMYYEYSKGLYKNNKQDIATKINEYMLGGGLDVYYKNYGFTMQVYRTVYEDKIPNVLSSSGRLSVGLTYNF